MTNNQNNAQAIMEESLMLPCIIESKKVHDVEIGKIPKLLIQNIYMAESKYYYM